MRLPNLDSYGVGGGTILTAGGAMIKDMSFGNLFKEIRIKNRETLRAYCLRTGFQPGNISKMERNLLPPPSSKEKLLKLLSGMEYSELEIDFLLTAAQNYHIAKVISRF